MVLPRVPVSESEIQSGSACDAVSGDPSAIPQSPLHAPAASRVARHLISGTPHGELRLARGTGPCSRTMHVTVFVEFIGTVANLSSVHSSEPPALHRPQRSGHCGSAVCWGMGVASVLLDVLSFMEVKGRHPAPTTHIQTGYCVMIRHKCGNDTVHRSEYGKS